MPIKPVQALDEAIAKANESEFGLGSSIFARELTAVWPATDEIEAGYTWVNALQIAREELPVGGVTHSGYGKEHGTEVLDSYTEFISAVIAGSDVVLVGLRQRYWARATGPGLEDRS